MRIALGIHSLAGLGGTESYTITVADHLQRIGHDVWVYGGEEGASAEIARSRGLRTVFRATDLPQDLDVAISQDSVASFEIAEAYPKLPQVYVAHSPVFDLQHPPQIDGLIACVVTLNQRVYDRIVADSMNLPIVQLLQPIDVHRFKPLNPLPATPRVAMVLGNYLAGERRSIVEEACALAGLELRLVGGMADRTTSSSEEVLHEADIVFGVGRVIHEAMACGRAAYALGENGCEGWVTRQNYEKLVGDNFAGFRDPQPLTAEALAADLEKYDPAMGMANRDLMVAHHGAIEHASKLVAAIREHVPNVDADAGGPVGDTRNDGVGYSPYFELGRLARLVWRHESHAFIANKLHDVAAFAKQKIEIDMAQAQSELAHVRSELARANEARAAAEQAAADASELIARAERDRHESQRAAEAASDILKTMTESKRWRVIAKLLRPIDRLRGR